MIAPTLWSATRDFLQGNAGLPTDFAALLPPSPATRACDAPPEGLSRPVPVGLAALAGTATQATHELCRAVTDSGDRLTWRSSYAADDVGAFATGYAWAAIAGPDGPLVAPDAFVSVMYVGPDLTYPRHRHTPEEVYAVLAGTAEFWSDRQGAGWCRAGDLRHHLPNEWHGLRTGPDPVLVLSVWRGRYEKSEIVEKAA